MGRQQFDPNNPAAPGAWGGTQGIAAHWAGNGPSADAQGNVTGTVVQGTPSGEQADVSRYRDIGDQMQKRDPYKFDWSQSDQSHAQAADAAGAQQDASNTWQDQATGKDRTSFNYGKSLLDRGAQNQQAGALSTSGGPLAQVGAAARAQNGQSAFMQKGTQELEAQHADDMAAGRSGWAGALGQQRKMDATGQSLSDQQTELQAQAAAQQNKLNDAGQYDLEKMGVDVEGQAVAGRQHAEATSDTEKKNQQAAADATRNRQMGTFNTVVSTAGNAVAPGAGTAFSNVGSATQQATDPSPDPTSDRDAKDKLPANALLSMVQTPGKLSAMTPDQDEGENDAKASTPEQDLQKEYIGQADKPKATEASTAPAVTGYGDTWSTWGNDSPEKSNRTRALQEAREDMVHDNLVKGRSNAMAQAKEDQRGTYEAGPGRAPKGYAASRAGKPGDMFYGGEQKVKDDSYDSKHGLAPGSRDYMKYGDIEGGPDARMQNARRTMTMDPFSQSVMTSDERTKNKAETPEEKKAREDKQDAEETAAFTKDIRPGAITVKKPASYEEASKAIDERNAQDQQIKDNQKKANEEQGRQYMANQDAELIRRNNADNAKSPLTPGWLPGFVQRWSNKKIEERQKNRTPDQNIQQAVSRDKRDVERQKTEHQYDQSGPGPLRKFVEDLNVATAKQRQPQSFTRGDDSEASLQANEKADKIAYDREHPADAPVSDERAKNKGYKINKGAGGGEEEHDATVMEHRGPASANETPMPGAPDAKHGAKGAGEERSNDETTISRTPPLTEAPASRRASNPLIEMQKHANHQLRGETYQYKDGFGEDPNQVHHGFMAQNLEQNPITATAVREDETGIKKVNNEDALRVTAAGVASLQEQHDELEAAVAALAARRGKKVA